MIDELLLNLVGHQRVIVRSSENGELVIDPLVSQAIGLSEQECDAINQLLVLASHFTFLEQTAFLFLDGTRMGLYKAALGSGILNLLKDYRQTLAQLEKDKDATMSLISLQYSLQQVCC